MKLPKRKYEAKHNDELYLYAVGWNETIEEAEHLGEVFSGGDVIKCLSRLKEHAYKYVAKPDCKGVYDCIVEIERLNAKEEEE